MSQIMSPGGFVGTQLFVVPRGAPTLYRGDWKPARRKQVIDLGKPECNARRYADRRRGREESEWVVVTWPGAGGYWRRAVTHDGEFVAEMPS
jgi:hypothetical protein